MKPLAGWAGLLQENAKLTASDGAANDFFGQSIGVSGETVVVDAYVFVKPAAGWAEALQESARLTGSFISSVAVSGDVVVTGRSVFRKPPGGWAGAVTESAQLTGAGSVAVSGNTVVTGSCRGGTTQDTACVFEGLAEAEPAANRITCKAAGCKLRITCNLAQNCTNRINLLVRARGARLREEARAGAPRMIRFASAVANIPPGVTQPVRFKLTKRGRDVVSEKKKRRLKGVIEIRNTAGTAIDRTPIPIRLR